MIQMENDPDVNVVFVNMFCGNMRADKVAVILKEVYEKGFIKKPAVVRIKGLNSEDANQII